MSGSDNTAADTVTVIGAGVVGLACAVCLQRQGYRVSLIDRDEPASGASAGNAGSISTGSVVPVALPGMAHQIPSWLFDRDGPLSVRWSYLPRAAPWLLRWLRSAREEPVRRAAVALATLTLSSVDNWSDILDPEDRARFLRRQGQLLVSRSADPSPGDLFAQRLREENGVNLAVLNADEIRQMEPELASDFKRGLFIADSGHSTDPQRMALRLYAYFLAAGGTFMNADVVALESAKDGTVVSAVTSGGRLATDRIVVAAGAYSNRLASTIGDAIPLETERGYHCMLPDPGIDVRRPVSDMDRKFFATGMEDGVRIAGTVEIAGVDAAPNYDRARLLMRQGREMFPRLSTDQHRYWMGRRPSIPDSMPVIGPSPSRPNVWYAFGHGHIGLTTAPITGRIIAALIAGAAPPVDPTPFSVDRFRSRTVNRP